MLKISRGLEADGTRNGTGRNKWHTSNINNILRNEKYIGDALLQKTYTTDSLTKTRVKNNGLVPQYYVKTAMRPLSRGRFSCRCKKSWSGGVSSRPARIGRTEPSAATIASLR
ncbi:recombinase family protein [Paenibacillus sp. FSL R10-2791]|uniref:recombinase family protein n=1 Tax=unclassified Paenibacillus TaxID=185978 RepID=UPI0030F876AE